MFRTNLTQAIKHSSIYSLSWVANAVAGVALLPVYSRYLSRADYGALDLVNQNNTILKIVFVSCFTYSLGRLYHDTKSEQDKRNVLASGATGALVAGIVASSCLLLFHDQVSQLLLGNTTYSNLIVAGALVLLLDIVFTGFAYELIVTNKSAHFVFANLVKLCIAIVVNLICLLWLDLAALGMLIGNACGLTAANVYVVGRHMKHIGLIIDRATISRMISFGSPMIIAGVLAAALHSSDRLMLRPFSGLDQVGLFMMGLQFPNMLNAILVTSFGRVWGGSLMFTMSKQSDADRQIGRMATYLLAFFISAQTILGIFSSTLIEILAAPKFAISAAVAPIACLGFCFHSIYLFLVTKAFTHGNPRRMVPAYAIPLIAKIALTFYLVPIYGYMASAFILMLGYLTFAMTCFLLFRKESTTQFDWNRIVLLYGLGTAFLSASYLTNTASTMQQICLQVLLAAAYVGTLATTPIFTKSEKSALYKEVRDRISKFTQPTSKITQ